LPSESTNNPPQSTKSAQLQQVQQKAIQKLNNLTQQIKGNQPVFNQILSEIVQAQPTPQAVETYVAKKEKQLEELAQVNNLLEEVKDKIYHTVEELEQDIDKLGKFEMTEPNSDKC
jgi:DNA repair ATPase RecN